MIRKMVESSNIKSMGYNPTSRILEVEFQNGGIYKYFDIPLEDYNSVIFAESIGKEFHKKIIQGGYSYEKLGS